MRGCVKAVLFLLLFSSSVSGDCSWTPRRSVGFRTTALDLAIDGEFLWLATGYGVQLISNGRIVSNVAVPGLTSVVASDGAGLAYAGSGSRVYALRREGNAVRLTGSAAASGRVNDIVVASGYLFVATTNGIDHFSLFDPSGPTKTSVTLPTTSPNVSSLAATHTMLYAADGDSTIETYTITLPSLPQHVGVLESLQFSTAVHTSPDGQVFVSDAFGQNTDVFSGITRIARLTFGTTSYAPLTSQAAFIAGPNRTVAAVDFSSPSRVARLFEHQLSPTDGTDNVIHAMARSGDTLYVAGGDMGLLMFDGFAQPYPLASYTTGATSSVRADGQRAWLADGAGNISQQRIDAAGLSLIEERSWSAGEGAVIQDARTNGLLTSSGSSVTLWALVSSPPTAATTLTFASPVKTAVSSEAFIVALLDDDGGTVWKASGSQTNPEKVNVPPMDFLARAGSAIILGEIRESDGKTILHYYPAGDFGAESRTITIDGVAIGNVALDATRAAVFTFTGINVIDLESGSVRVIPDSNRIIPRQLEFAGDDLLLLDSRRLVVYEDARTAVRQHSLPSNATAVDSAGNVAVMSTSDGMAALAYFSALPVAQSPFSNNFYDRIAAGGDQVYLLHDDGVDVLAILPDDSIRYVTSIRAAGIVAMASSDTALYTLSANGSLGVWSRAGIQTAQAIITDGFESQPLSIAVAGNALWVSIMSGCTSGGCQRRTIVVDPSTLVTTSSMTGALRDITVSGTRAYALFDAPNEIRVVNIADALHPSQIAAVARPSTATSISHDASTVYVLGDKLYSYSEESLVATGERLEAITPPQSQRMRIDDGCAVVIGRSESAQLYSVPSWTESAAAPLPSTPRAVSMQPGRVIILTDHSIEFWSSLTAGKVGRRRAVR